jgi:hypothetical protein
LTYKSDLVRSSIPSDGVLHLQGSKLKPGSYYVVIQKTRQGGQGIPVLVKGKKPWKIEISPDAKLPLVVDGEDVKLP